MSGRIPVGLALLMLFGGQFAALAQAPRSASDPTAKELSELRDLRLVLISPATGRAVVQRAEGRFDLVVAGSALPESSWEVIEVLPDRLALAPTDRKPVLGRKERAAPRWLCWLSKEAPVGGTSRVECLSRERPSPPPALRPATSVSSRGPARE